MGLIAGIGTRALRRSHWLAERLWVIAAAEVAITTRRHWRRLGPEERARFFALVRKSRGRPSRLTDRETDELRRLLDKLGHIELAGSVARTVIPFRPVGRIVEFAAARATRHRTPSGAEA